MMVDMEATPHFEHVGLVVKADDRALAKADEFEQWLTRRGCRVQRKNSPALVATDPAVSEVPADESLQCVFVLGGDGTFLSAVRWIGTHDIPIHGVKFGEVGFLAETEADELFEAADEVLAGRFRITNRIRLQICVQQNGQTVFSEVALNDMVINKGALARLADIKTFIDDHYLTTFRADGLIVATPTGSTAYSLAAGGPVVHPELCNIIITPICPFTLTNRPLIVPSSVGIRLEPDQNDDIMLTVDGQSGHRMGTEDVVEIREHPRPVRLITLLHQNYYDILKAKLSWSGGRS